MWVLIIMVFPSASMALRNLVVAARNTEVEHREELFRRTLRVVGTNRCLDLGDVEARHLTDANCEAIYRFDFAGLRALERELGWCALSSGLAKGVAGRASAPTARALRRECCPRGRVSDGAMGVAGEHTANWTPVDAAGDSTPAPAAAASRASPMARAASTGAEPTPWEAVCLPFPSWVVVLRLCIAVGSGEKDLGCGSLKKESGL